MVNLNIGAFRNLNLKTGEEADFSSFGSLLWRDDCKNEVQVGKWVKDPADWKGGRALGDSPLRPWLGWLPGQLRDAFEKADLIVFPRPRSR